MWRQPSHLDPHHRDDVDAVFVGRQYIYQWIERYRHVRRYDLATGEETITKARRRPRWGLELTKLFYNTRMSRRHSHKIIRKKANPHPQGRRPHPSSAVMRIEPRDLDTAQLTAVYRRLNPDWPPTARFRDHAAARIRVDSTLASIDPSGPWVLVNHPPLDAARSMSVFPSLHIIPLSSLPADAGRHGRRRWSLDSGITVLVPNPKKEDTASWARFELYDQNTTIRAYVERCVAHGHPRHVAMADVINDQSRGYISVSLPADSGALG